MKKIKNELYVNLKDIAKVTKIKYGWGLMELLKSKVQVSEKDDIKMWIRESNGDYLLSYLAIYYLFNNSNVDYHLCDELFK